MTVSPGYTTTYGVPFGFPAFEGVLLNFDLRFNETFLRILYCSSGFGRTLITDGTGTDHAWGGNYMLWAARSKARECEYSKDLCI